MNKNQKRILIAVVVVVLAMFIYPPFQAVRNGTVYNMGYGWIFALSNRGYMTINVSMLIIQWIGVFIVGGIAFFLAKGASATVGLSSKQNLISPQHAYNNPKMKEDEERKPIKNSWLVNASTILGVFIVLIITKGFAKTITKDHGALPFLGDFIFISLVCWAWFRGWRWWALIPPAVALGFAFILGFFGANIGNKEGILAIFNMTCWVALGIMIFMKREMDDDTNTDAAIEKIISVAEARSTEKHTSAQKQSSSEYQQNDEFIVLLKSAITENGLNTIPGDDLIEIYKRARAIAEASNQQDMELLNAVTMLSEEITNRGLSKDITKSQEKEPQDNSDYKESSSQQNKADRIFEWNWGFVITGLLIGIAVTIVLFGLKSNYPNQESQNTEAVAKTQEASQELTAESWVNKARALVVDGKHTDPNKAIEYLNNAIKLEPGYARAYIGRGSAYADLGQHQRAIEDYNEAIRLKPDDCKVYYKRGLAYADLGKHQQAIENYDQGLRLKPNDPYGYYFRGIAFAELGQFNQAIENYSEAIRLKPDYADFYIERSSSYLSLGNKSLGCSDIKKVCELGTCARLEWAKTNRICR